MIKALIVDDERMFRKAFIATVPWEAHGFEIIGEAENGAEAAELLAAHACDVVFTDILMPRMDGLELMKHIKAHYPEITVIILSCHSEFAYAKEAMKQGARDYILKLSVTPENISDLLEEIKDFVEKRDCDKKKLEMMDQEKENLLSSLVQKILNRNLAISEDDFHRSRQIYGLKMRYQNNFMALVDVVNFHDAERMKGSFNLYEQFYGEVAPMMDMDLIKLSENRFIVIGNIAGASYQDVFESVVDRADAHNIKLSVTMYSHDFCIKDVNDIFYGILLPASGQYFFDAAAVRYAGHEQKKVNSREFENFLAILEKLSGNLLVYRYRELLGKLYAEVAESDGSSEAKLKAIVGNIRIILAAILEAEQNLVFKFDCHMDKIYTIIELNNVFENMITEFCNSSLGIEYKNMKSNIKDVINYIFAHVDRNVTLKEAAGIANLNERYFSDLFKKEVGKSFVGFITDIKIRKAKNMLITEDYRIYEISNRLGFDNETYFTKVFKKITSCTPQQYRKLNSKSAAT